MLPTNYHLPSRPDQEVKRSHALRYVLKNRETDEIYLAVLFTLYLKQDVDEEGNIKEGVEGGKLIGKPVGVEDDEDGEEVKDGNSAVETKAVVETNEDDVD